MWESDQKFPAGKRFFMGSVLIVVVAALVASLTAFSQREDVVQQLQENAIPDVSRWLDGEVGGPRTILLIGSDRRKEDKKYGLPARSDTMMLVRLDPNLKVTPVLSMPRDLKVSIPGRGLAKINEAYSLGGAKLVIRTITESTGIKINHVINVDFKGFRQAVDRIGCVYVDIDRRYFNDNVGRYVGEAFATINIKAGYQKLCGQKALDYVRFRHYDSDIYRNARQQWFLRQAKQQVGVTKLFASAKSLKKIISNNTRTDSRLAHGAALQRLLTLGVKSAGKPVYQVQIPNLEYDNRGASYVIASNSSLEKAAKIFREGPPLKGGRQLDDGVSESTRRKKRKRKKPTSSGSLPPGMIAAKDEGKKQAVAAGFGIKLPVFYPTVRMSQSKYETPRSYRLSVGKRKRASAWRIVVKLTNDVGEYYGVQGVNWEDPPILANPSAERKLGGRNFKLYYEGNKLGMIAFTRKGAAFWVQNTLTRKLTEKQMLAIARSLRMRR